MLITIVLSLFGFVENNSYGAITPKPGQPAQILQKAESCRLPSIGWIEKISFTLTDMKGKIRTVSLEAKVDTGAKTSSLHARAIKTVKKGGKEFARFVFSWGKENHEFEALVQERKRVKSSDGEGEEREFIEVETCIGGTKHPLLISLNDRGNMQYPLLLGRRFLEEKFLVDAANKFILGKPNCR